MLNFLNNSSKKHGESRMNPMHPDTELAERSSMNGPIRIVDVLIVVVKALLIAGAITWLGGYFGLRVREAGGSATHLCASDARAI